MSKRRDDFLESTKCILGNRVAWICSFPGCNDVTVGPGSDSTKHVLKLGDAAHIHAAAKEGPRYDPDMSIEERRAIDNGIWMCQRHARLIDADYTEYSAATLRKWKVEAENKSYESLRLPGRLPCSYSSTLIQLGSEIIFYGKWIGAGASEWILEVGDYVYGNEYSLKDYCSQFEKQPDREKFIVIQDQGDGRWIEIVPIWKIVAEKMQLMVTVGKKYVRQDPNQTGTDIALSLSGDIYMKDGQIATVDGIASAKQQIMTVLSVRPGDFTFRPAVGSKFSKYFLDHKNNKELLSSLLMLEIVRLASLPDEGRETSPLGFINRVIEATFCTTNIISGRVSALVEIEWGSREITKEYYSIFVDHDNVKVYKPLLL